jgi:hypothetical protein
MKLSDGKVKLLSRNYHKLHRCIYILYKQRAEIYQWTYLEAVGGSLLSIRLEVAQF